MRDRIGDRRVVRLIKAFLKAGVLTEDGHNRDTKMGTPQGGILSPLLANIALSVLDEHFAEAWQRDMATRPLRERRRRHGHATYRLVRYADDFVVMVAGTKAHAEDLKHEVAAVLSTVGLRLSEDKTMIVDIDEGFDFLGFRIQRQTKRGSYNRYVYTWPTKKALASIKAKVKTITKQGTNQPLSAVKRQLNGVLRGWTTYFRHAVSNATFGYVHQFTWQTRRRMDPPQASARQLEVAATALPRQQVVARARRHGPVRLSSSPGALPLPRGRGSRRRGARPAPPPDQRHGLGESRMRWKSHVRFGGRVEEPETHPTERRTGRSGPIPCRQHGAGRVPPPGAERDTR